jgi:hypothetical protein
VEPISIPANGIIFIPANFGYIAGNGFKPFPAILDSGLRNLNNLKVTVGSSATGMTFIYGFAKTSEARRAKLITIFTETGCSKPFGCKAPSPEE